MHLTRIQRRPIRRRSSCSVLTCGCLTSLIVLLAAAVVGFFLLRPNLANIAAQVMGFSERGSTAVLFQSVTPIPTVQLQNQVEPAQFTVDAGQYGAQTLSGDSALYEVAVGTDASGAQAATVSFTEAGLQELCQQRADVCGPTNPRYRNARIDLRPGGAVVYADVVLQELGSIEQTVGAVLRLDGSGQRFEFAGVDIGGTVYDVPPHSFGATVSDLEQRGNDLLNQLRLDAAGSQFAVSQVSIDDDTLTVLLR
jgi:hypothetical protein